MFRVRTAALNPGIFLMIQVLGGPISSCIFLQICSAFVAYAEEDFVIFKIADIIIKL